MSALDAFRLDGRIALVTGATGGLGEQAALALAEAGATVIITGRREHRLTSVAERIRATGAEAHARSLDMTDSDAVRSTFSELASTAASPWSPVRPAVSGSRRPSRSQKPVQP